jgi:hypothetical protein
MIVARYWIPDSDTVYADEVDRADWSTGRVEMEMKAYKSVCVAEMSELALSLQGSPSQ